MPSRRKFMGGAGALVVNFSLLSRAAPDSKADLPRGLKDAPHLDSWIRIDAKNSITVFSGKAELGQGIKTALIQIAAEELEVDAGAIRLICADTQLTPNEGYTAGSHSVQDSGEAIRHAAAQAREILISAAASKLGVSAERLEARAGSVLSNDGRAVKYGELVAGNKLHVEAQPNPKLKRPENFRVMGQPVPRVDIPAKVTGGVAYVQDLRLPNMVHARVVRPPSPAARLLDVNLAAVEKRPGVLKVVRDGSFLAVIATGEYQAIQAMEALEKAARWEEKTSLPSAQNLPSVLKSLKAEDAVVLNQKGESRAGAQTFEATYTRPYQAHASIGPSCAVAFFENGSLTVWSHTQGVYPDRAAIAEMLGMPLTKVRCIHMEGAGCYGHNGADDAAADAALIARALPGRPVRLQWMREQEHAWEPYGPAMVTTVHAQLDVAGKITQWNYELWSNTHVARPGPASQLLAARHIEKAFAPQPTRLRIGPEGTGDRNAVPLYAIPGKHIVWHFLPDAPLRVSALRALGAYMNVFSIESFMDELALAAKADPVEFRLRHLDDERARAVIQTAADRFGWSQSKSAPDRGQGFAFARYKNLAAYCAVAIEVKIDRASREVRVLRAVAAVDSGEIVNPDGIKNQIEGGIVQSLSWTLHEAVRFDDTRITSTNWTTYPILRFSEVPESVEVHVIPRPGQPFLGTGEAAQGPAAAALANAIASATGRRLRDLPLIEKLSSPQGASGTPSKNST